jgi:hypothetical protein
VHFNVKAGGQMHKLPVGDGKEAPLNTFHCKGCGKVFKNSQGLGSHARECAMHIQLEADAKKKQEGSLIAAFGRQKEGTRASTVFAPGSRKAPKERIQKSSSSSSNRSSILIGDPSEDSAAAGENVTPAKEDRRKTNRGSGCRQQFSPEQKLKYLDEFDASGLTPSKYVSAKELPSKFTQYLTKSGWNKDRQKLEKVVSEKKYGKFRLKQKQGDKRTISPYHLMEDKLYKKIQEKRKAAAKVSSTFIRTTAKKLMGDMNHPLKNKFKASNGWFRRFCKRRKLKFLKKKSGKNQSAEDQLQVILTWYGYFRHKVLPCIDSSFCPDFNETWGRYPW